MSKNKAGLTEVAYADTIGGAYTAITGKIAADSTIEAPNTTSETTVGLLFGGGQATGELRFLDMANLSAVQAFMTGDAEKFWRFTFADGTILYTQEAIIPFTRREMLPNARDGVMGWFLDLEHYGADVMIDTTNA